MSIQFKPTPENDRRYEEATRWYIINFTKVNLTTAQEWLEEIKMLDKEFAGLGEP